MVQFLIVSSLLLSLLRLKLVLEPVGDVEAAAENKKESAIVCSVSAVVCLSCLVFAAEISA